MNTRRFFLILGVLIAVGIGVVYLLGRRHTASDQGPVTPRRIETSSPSQETDLAHPGDRAVIEPGLQAHETGGDGGTKPQEPTDRTESWWVFGQVLTLDGEPVPNVHLAWIDSVAPPSGFAPESTSGVGLGSAGPDGKFQLRLDRTGILGVQSADYATFAGCRITADGGPHVVIAAPRVTIRGLVLDREGAPVEGAELTLEISPFKALAQASNSVHLPMDEWNARSGSDGRYVLEGIPAAGGNSSIRASRPGYLDSMRRLPDSSGDVDFVLHSPADGHVLEGQVLTPDGEAAMGATVGLGMLRAEVASDGVFRMKLPYPPVQYRDQALVAFLEGYQPAIDSTWAFLLEEDMEVPWCRLVLPGMALSIAGRVLLDSGEGAAGWSVVATDYSPAEFLSPVLDGVPASARNRHERSSASGEFSLPNLLDRDYVVQAWDPATFLVVRTGPIAAGTSDLTLTVPNSGILEELDGRVIGLGGGPLAGVHVSLGLRTREEPSLPLGGMHTVRETVRTREDGSFLLRDVPRAHVHLLVSDERLIPQAFDIQELEESPVLVVAARRGLRVRRDALDLEAWLESSNGLRVQVYLFSANATFLVDPIPFEGKDSPIVWVPETADAIVFRAPGGVPVRSALPPWSGSVDLVSIP